MTVSEVIEKMIAFSEGNMHDINHFLKVYAFAKTIGELEKLPEDEMHVLEIAAAVHDIACPICRVKYGSTLGAYQEAESEAQLKAFFRDTDIEKSVLERVIHIVSHHHTYTGVDSMAYRVLLEADYLVNADESSYSREKIENAKKIVFETASGLELLNTMYL